MAKQEYPFQTWERITNKPWKAAKEGGYTTGKYQENLSLQKKLLGGWNPFAIPEPKVSKEPKIKEPEVPKITAPVLPTPTPVVPKPLIPKLELPKPSIVDTTDYKIQSKDTLSQIAERFKVTIDDILKLNRDKIPDQNIIQVGDVIKIPTITAKPPTLPVSDMFRITPKEKVEFKATLDQIRDIDVSPITAVTTPSEIPGPTIVPKIKDWITTNIFTPVQDRVTDHFLGYSDKIQKELTDEDIEREGKKALKLLDPQLISNIQEIIDKVTPPSASLSPKYFDKRSIDTSLLFKKTALQTIVKPKIQKDYTFAEKVAEVFNVGVDLDEVGKAKKVNISNIVIPGLPTFSSTRSFIMSDKIVTSDSDRYVSDAEVKKNLENDLPPADIAAASAMRISVTRDMNRWLENYPEYQLEFLEDSAHHLIDVNSDNLTKSIDELVDKKIEELISDGVPPILVEHGKRVEEWDKLLGSTAAQFASISESFIPFLMDPENFTITMDKQASQRVLDMLGTSDEIQALDPTFNNLTSLYNKYRDVYEQAENYFPQISTLNSEKDKLMTPDMQSFFESWQLYDTLSTSQKEVLETFYITNKITVDIIIGKLDKLEEIRLFILANQDKLQALEDAQVDIRLQSLASFDVPLEKLIRSKDFIDILTLYSRKSATPKTELLQHFQKLFDQAQWFDDNDTKVKREIAKLDQDKQDAELSLVAYQQKLQGDMDYIWNLVRQRAKAEIDYQQFERKDTLINLQERSNYLSLINTPYTYATAPDYFYNLWKNRKKIWEHKAPLLVEIVGGVVSNVGDDYKFRDILQHAGKTTLTPWPKTGNIIKDTQTGINNLIKDVKDELMVFPVVPALALKQAWKALVWLQTDVGTPFVRKIVIPAHQASSVQTARTLAWFGYEGTAAWAKLTGTYNFKENVSYMEALRPLQMFMNIPTLPEDIYGTAGPFTDSQDLTWFIMNRDNPSIMEDENKKLSIKPTGLLAQWMKDFEYFGGLKPDPDTGRYTLEDFKDCYQNLDNVETFTIQKDTHIKELLGKDWRNTMLSFQEWNPHIIDPTKIVKGTKVTIEKIDPPSFTNILAPELRMKFKISHPVAYFVSNIIPEIVFDPTNILFIKYATVVPKMASFVGLGLYSKVTTLAKSYKWASQVQEIWQFSDQITRLFTNKPLAAFATREVSQKGLINAMVPTLKNLDKLRTGLQGISLAKAMPYKIRQVVGEMSDGLRRTMAFGEESNIIDILTKEAKGDPKVLAKLKQDIVESLLHQDQRPADIVLKLLHKRGSTTFDVWNFAKKYPDSTEFVEQFVSNMYSAKHREQFLSQYLIDEIHRQSPQTQDVFNALVKATKKELPDVLKQAKSRFVYYQDDIKKGIAFYDDYIRSTDKALKAFNDSIELVKLEKNDWRYLQIANAKTRKAVFGNEKYLTGVLPDGTSTVIFDYFAYHDLPDMIADGIAFSAKKYMQTTADLPVYSLKYSLPHTESELRQMLRTQVDAGLSIDTAKKVLVQRRGNTVVKAMGPKELSNELNNIISSTKTHIAKGVPRPLITTRKTVARSHTLQDIRNNDFYTNWLPRLLPEENTRLMKILDVILPAKQLKKHWGTSWAKTQSDRALEAYSNNLLDNVGVKMFAGTTDSFIYYSNYRKIQEFLTQFMSLRRFELDNPVLFKDYINYLTALQKGKEITLKYTSTPLKIAESFNMTTIDLVRFNPALKGQKIIKANTSIIVRNWTPSQELHYFISKLSDRSFTPLQRIILMNRKLTTSELDEAEKIIRALTKGHKENATALELARTEKTMIKAGASPEAIKRQLLHVKSSVQVDFSFQDLRERLSQMTDLYGVETQKIPMGRFLKKSLPALKGKRVVITETSQNKIAMELQKTYQKGLTDLSKKSGANKIKYVMDNNLDLSNAMKSNAWFPTEDFAAKLTKKDIGLMEGAISEGKTILFTNTTKKGKAMEQWFSLHPEFQKGFHYEIFGPEKILAKQTSWTPQKLIEELKRQGVYNKLRLNGAIMDDDIIKIMAASKGISKDIRATSLIDNFQVSKSYEQLRTTFYNALNQNDEGRKILKALNSGSEEKLTSLTHMEWFDDSTMSKMEANIKKYLKLRPDSTDTTVAKLFGSEKATHWLFEWDTLMQRHKQLLGIKDLELQLSKAGKVQSIVVRRSSLPAIPGAYEEICVRKAMGQFLIEPKNSKILNMFKEETIGTVFKNYSIETQDMVKVFSTMADWDPLKIALRNVDDLKIVTKKFDEVIAANRIISDKIVWLEQKGVAKTQGSLSKFLKEMSDKKLITPIDIKKNIFTQQLDALELLQKKGLLNSDQKILFNMMKNNNINTLKKGSSAFNAELSELGLKQEQLRTAILSQESTLDGLILKPIDTISESQRNFTRLFQQKVGLGKNYLKELNVRKLELENFLSTDNLARMKKVLGGQEYIDYVKELQSELTRLKMYEPFAIPYQIAAMNNLLPDVAEAKILASGLIPDSYALKLKRLDKLINQGKEITKAQFSLQLSPSRKVATEFTTEVQKGYSLSEMKQMFPDSYADLPIVNTFAFARVGEKGKGLSIDSVNKLLKQLEKRGVKTVIDDTGMISDLLGDTIFKIKIIKIPELAQSNLPYIAKKGTPLFRNQKIAMTKLRDTFFADHHIAILGFGEKRVSQIKDLVYRAQSSFEKTYLNSLWTTRKELNIILRGADVKGVPKMVMPRTIGKNFEPWEKSAYLIPSEAGVEVAMREARSTLQTAPWIQKYALTGDIYKGSRVLLVGGSSPILPLWVKDALEDATRKKCTFFVPTKMTSGERSMLEYLRKSNPKLTPKILSLTQDQLTEIATNVNLKLPEFILSSTQDPRFLNSVRAKAFNQLLGRGRIFRTTEQLQVTFRNEIYDIVKKFKSDPHKFFPTTFQAGLLRDPDPVKWMSKWFTMIKRENIQKWWATKKISLLADVKEEVLQDILTKRRTKLITPFEQELLNREMSAIKHGLDQFDTVFGFVDYKPGWFLRWRENINKRLYFTQKLTEAESVGLNNLPIEADKWNFVKKAWEQIEELPLEKYLIVPMRTYGAIKSGWIRAILYYRVAWHIRNAVDDAFRQAMGAHDAKLFFQITGAYGDATLQFAKHFGKNWIELAKEGVGYYSWGPNFKKWIGSKIGPTRAEKLIGKTAVKGTFLPFDIADIYKGRSPKFWGTRYGTAANWQLPKTKSILNPLTGEIVSLKDAKFASSAGFYSMFEDPVNAKVWLNRISESGYFKRLGKRVAVLDADIQLYAGATEELRRLMMYNTLTFDKGMQMAKAEALVKKWSFDYSDVDWVGRQARVFFPFFTFNRKSVSLWLTECLKYSYPAYNAGKALLKAWSLMTAGLPDWYQDRFKIGKNTWIKLPFSWVDILSLLKDPTRTLQEMLDNPLRLPLGLSWNPGFSALIENAQKKSYFTLGWQLKNQHGWTNWEIKHYLKEQEIEDKDLSTGGEGWMTLALSFIPGVQLLQSLFEIDISSSLREKSLLDSKTNRELFKLFGLNIRTLTDVDKALWAYFNLPPHLQSTWMDKMEKEQPGTYATLMDYFSIAQVVKVFNAKPEDKEEAMQKLKESTTINTFYSLENFKSGQGYEWLKRRPESKAILDKHWKGLEMTPYRLTSRAKHQQNILRGILLTYLKPIPQEMTEKKGAIYDILGLPNSYIGAFNTQELYDSWFDSYGNVRISSVEEANIILGEDWIDKGLALIDSEVIKDAAIQEEEWRYNASIAKTNKDRNYNYNLSRVFAIIPDNINDLEKGEQDKYWNIWEHNMKRYLTPEQQRRYTENIPAVQKQYRDAMKDYNKRWGNLISKFGEEDFEFFTEFYNQPKIFQQIYFLSNPDKAIWYPTAQHWLSELNKIQKIEEATFQYQSEDRKRLMSWLWTQEDKLKAWDKSNPGFYYKMKGWKDLFIITENNPELYYPEFYSKPQEWIDMVFKDDPIKALVYPFMYKFTQLMQLDKRNWDEKQKRTHLASDWFWSTRNKEAREAYNRSHLPVAKGHDILEYYSVWKNIMDLTEENPKEYFDIFNAQPEWFRKYYLSLPANANKAIYYPLAMILSTLSPEQFSIEFWKTKWKAARLAWDRDKPGFLNYMKFWRKLSTFAEVKNWKQYYQFYFAPANKEFRERYARNNPEGAAIMPIMRDYVQMSTDTWEQRKAKRDFLKEYPELIKHWAKNISADEAIFRTKAEEYYTLLDNVKANGSGRSYFLEFRKWKIFAKDYLKKNPDLALYFQKNSDEYTGERLELSAALQEYESLTFPAERTKFLDSHLKLKDYFYYSNPPGIRKIIDIQNTYFKLPDTAKQAYLNQHPELLEWWEITKLPDSCFLKPKFFQTYQTSLNKVLEFYKTYAQKDYKKAEILFRNLPSLYTRPGSSDEDDWFTLVVYREAMGTWSQIKVWAYSIYFFRQLPKWIRDQYFKKHPESKLLSYLELNRFLEDPLRVAYANRPNYAWVSRQYYKYDKNMPYKVKEEVQRRMIALGLWESRKHWGKIEWMKFWRNRTIKLNKLKEEDLTKLPLMQSQLIKVVQKFPLRVTPKPFGKQKFGVIQPFF